MIDNSLKEQLKSVFSLIEGNYELVARVTASHSSKDELVELLEDLVSCSDHLKLIKEEGETLELFLRKDDGTSSPFVFYAVPTGHEFSSLVLAILNFDGKGKNIPDEYICKKIKAIKGEHTIKTYISLSCTNCPEVVQSINLICIINPNLRHLIVDGSINQAEVEALNLQGVPAVYVKDKLVSAGKSSLSNLLQIFEKEFGIENSVSTDEVKLYDVLIVGAGPAGTSAAIYSARKGLKVGVVADRIGGQVKDTVGIENFISNPYTTGKDLSSDFNKHLDSYPIDLFTDRTVVDVKKEGGRNLIELQTKEKFAAPALIVATGASWRKLNIPGEDEYIGKGVAFCPHCDGPFYAGKDVAVIGGGNSGIEAALDLSGICHKVTVVEFMDNLKADKVLQEKAIEAGNIEIFTNTQSVEVIGDGTKVIGLKVKDRATLEDRIIDLSAIFVQIGLSANSDPFKCLVETTPIGEIKIDERCRTNVSGIYAAGDVSSVPYKQIVIAIGEGAKASLTAFEDRMLGKI